LRCPSLGADAKRLDERVERRADFDRVRELQAAPSIDAALAARDHADSTRAVAPLRPAEDAVHLDTTSMGFAEQVRFIVDRARPIFTR